LKDKLEEQKAARAKFAAKKEKLTKEEEVALEFDGPLRTVDFQKGSQARDEFQRNREAATSMMWLALGEGLGFFGVLLVGFAYLWRRGDLEWVRSTAAERLESRGVTPPGLPGVPSAPQVSEAVRPRETVAAGH